VYELARDIVEIGGQFIISPVITKCLEDAKPVALTERCDESLKLLRGIDAHLKGESVQILRPSTASLRRFLPTAKYRSVHPSPQLRRSAR
jgi:hypothetical protein